MDFSKNSPSILSAPTHLSSGEARTERAEVLKQKPYSSLREQDLQHGLPEKKMFLSNGIIWYNSKVIYHERTSVYIYTVFYDCAY